MNRRKFVRQASLASAGILAGSSCLQAANKKKPMIGIQLYSVRDEVSKGIEPVLAKLAQVGYTNVEMYGYDHGRYFGKDIKTIKGLLDTHGLISTSAHLGLGKYLNEGDDDELQLAANDAAVLGNTYITVPSLDGRYIKTLDGYKAIAARMNRAGELLKTSGLKFAFHNHATEFAPLEGSNGYEVLLKETDPALVKFELDLYWAYNAGKDPLEYFKNHPGRFAMWHVKDMDKKDRNKQTEVGNGSIDFKSIFKQQKLAGLEHFFVEQENYDVSPYDSIEKCYAYVKKNLV